MKAKKKKPTKAEILAVKKHKIDSHNKDIDNYIDMVHLHYKAHIKTPYQEVNAMTFSGFTASGFCSFTKCANFIDLINLLNSLKK